MMRYGCSCLTNNLNMIEPKQPFPQNLPYMQTPSSKQSQLQTDSSQKPRGEAPHSEALMARIQDLQRNLAELTALLAEDSGLQQAYSHLQQENEELRNQLLEKQGGHAEELEAANQLLKENLLKQNEEMEELYRELQEARNSHSRLQQRGHSELLESKVQELNDEISNLLVKIQELMDQNNTQQESIAEMQSLRNSFDQCQRKGKELQVENQILKEEIRNMEDHYIEQIAKLKQEGEELKNMQRSQPRPGQIRGNTERQEERSELEQEVISLRAELANRSEEQLEQRQQQTQNRKRWEAQLAKKEDEICSLHEEMGQLKAKLRQQENKCSEYEFVIAQQKNDRQQLSFYKSNYSASDTLRNTILKLQVEREELLSRIERLRAQLAQKMFEVPLPLYPQRNEVRGFMQDQAEEELEKSKRLNKELKASISRYQQDYKQMREQFERLLHEKVEAERIITANQLELQRHKAIYEQVVAKCNATAADYRELEKKVNILQGERTARNAITTTRAPSSLYDKENIQLIQLENSTLRQEIATLKDQLLYKDNFVSAQTDAQAKAKRQERELRQELDMLRKKYMKELQAGKRDQQLQNRVSDLQEKLARVNRLLNEKLKQLEHLQNRERQLLQQVDQAYARSKMEFETFGVRHHPEVKKLQAELLATQRQLMESELTFKNQISTCEDELRACRLENQHHRAKIDQLLLEVNRERNSLDYSKLARSLELNELKQREMQRQLQHKDRLLDDLRGQLKQMQSRERSKLEASLAQKDFHLQQEKENLELRIRQQETGLSSLAQCLNALEPTTRSEDTLKRAINFLSKMTASAARTSLNEGHRKDSISSKQSQNSRYEELSRKKSLIAEQFKRSEQFLLEGQEQRVQKRGGRESKEEKGGILRRLQENWAT